MKNVKLSLHRLDFLGEANSEGGFEFLGEEKKRAPRPISPQFFGPDHARYRWAPGTSLSVEARPTVVSPISPVTGTGRVGAWPWSVEQRAGDEESRGPDACFVEDGAGVAGTLRFKRERLENIARIARPRSWAQREAEAAAKALDVDSNVHPYPRHYWQEIDHSES